jgi:hypothetical protein
MISGFRCTRLGVFLLPFRRGALHKRLTVKEHLSKEGTMQRTIVSVAAVVVLAAGSARADDKPALPNLALHVLIASPAIQAELKLDEEQKKAIDDAAAEARQALQGVNQLQQAERQQKNREVRQNLQTKLEKALKEEQLKRLNQIDLQQKGALVLNTRETADKVGVTNEQRPKIRALNMELTQTTTKLRQEFKGKELQDKIAQARAEASAKVVELLTDEQKKSWQALVGEPFDLAKLRA